jgi:integrase
LAELKLLVRKGEYQKWKRKFNDCAIEWLESLDTRRQSNIRYESIYRVHLLPYFGSKRVVDIVNYDNRNGKNMVQAYFEKKIDLPESSLKKHARVLRWIMKLGDPSFELPAIVYRNKGFYQTKFMKQNELDAVIGYLDDQHQAIALLMAYTGFSLGDAVNIKWSVIDLKNRMIRIVRGKTQVKVSMPVCDALYDLLRYRFRVRNIHDNRVFNVGKQGFQKGWKRAVGKSDMNWKPRPTDLRHFFASYLLNNGEDHLVVANLMGHSSVNMLRKRYGHYGDDRLKKAMKLFDTNSTKLPQQDVN